MRMTAHGGKAPQTKSKSGAWSGKRVGTHRHEEGKSRPGNGLVRLRLATAPIRQSPNDRRDALPEVLTAGRHPGRSQGHGRVISAEDIPFGADDDQRGPHRGDPSVLPGHRCGHRRPAPRRRPEPETAAEPSGAGTPRGSRFRAVDSTNGTCRTGFTKQDPVIQPLRGTKNAEAGQSPNCPASAEAVPPVMPSPKAPAGPRLLPDAVPPPRPSIKLHLVVLTCYHISAVVVMNSSSTGGFSAYIRR
jgi:hypothetical protein